MTSASGKYSITFAHASGGNGGDAAAASSSTVTLARFDDLLGRSDSRTEIIRIDLLRRCPRESWKREKEGLNHDSVMVNGRY
ncbi:hypothetical protein ACHAWO_004924 [Cyclotella atomus]|uniref:Uncharacterized protein n=1 Tax=Cyclotella atomus TaxID=382360 RepID=A0ABD3PVY6_9STRA